MWGSLVIKQLIFNHFIPPNLTEKTDLQRVAVGTSCLLWGAIESLSGRTD